MDSPSNVLQFNTNYFTLNEISSALKDVAFQNCPEDVAAQDRWEDINSFRKIVWPAIEQGLYEIISPCLKDYFPAIEIGSGIGYSIREPLAARTIRIQPSSNEGQLLKNSIPYPVYQLNIEDLSTRLQQFQKNIPLFFALNVFDTMTSENRVKNLTLLSGLQSKKDKIIILLDTNPFLESVLEELKILYPEHTALPFFPRNAETCKQSVLIVPLKYCKGEPTVFQWVTMCKQEAENVARGFISGFQYHLHQLKEKENLKVIVLEDFIAEKMKSDLTSAGYTPTVRYHASFAIGPISVNLTAHQDLVYKAVTDTCALRGWSFDDKKFKDYLASKNLALPSSIDGKPLQEIRKNGQKVMGTEFLVIEGVKGL